MLFKAPPPSKSGYGGGVAQLETLRQTKKPRPQFKGFSCFVGTPALYPKRIKRRSESRELVHAVKHLFFKKHDAILFFSKGERRKMTFQDYIPVHGIEDRSKFESLVISMRNQGWVGSPLIAHGAYLLCGSHRFAAACEVAKNDYRFDVPIEQVVDLFDIDPDDVTEDLYEITLLARQSNLNLAKELGLDIE